MSDKKILISTMNYLGKTYRLRYEDMDSFDDLNYEKCRQVYGVCFYNEKLVIGRGGKKNDWGLIGGTIEEGETFEETLKREVLEESNMKVLNCVPIGVQEVFSRDNGSFFQLRYAVSVEPVGEFVGDTAGGVMEIKLINPKNYKNYFDWGEIGERIIDRAMDLKETL